MEDEDLEGMRVEQGEANGIPWPDIHVPPIVVTAGKLPTTTKSDTKTSKSTSAGDFSAEFGKNLKRAFV